MGEFSTYFFVYFLSQSKKSEITTVDKLWKSGNCNLFILEKSSLQICDICDYVKFGSPVM